MDCAKHWQAVFVFKSDNADVEAAASDGIVMLEAGKETGYLMGQGYWTSHEALDFERPRKVSVHRGALRVDCVFLFNLDAAKRTDR